MAERLQAMGYEVASLNMTAEEGTMVFDDGRVLTVAEPLDLAGLTYRPDGSTDTPDRVVDNAPGVIDGAAVDDLSGERGLFTVLFVIAAAVITIYVAARLYYYIKVQQTKGQIKAIQSTIKQLKIAPW